MAARLYPAPLRPPEIVDLRRLSARDLEPLLQEETAAWRDELEWDFDKSADLVRRFVDLRALNGSALVEDGEVTGYLYYVIEENKGLIGDLYVRREWRTRGTRERMLLEWSLEAVMACPPMSRIESQLMMLRFAPDALGPARRLRQRLRAQLHAGGSAARAAGGRARPAADVHREVVRPLPRTRRRS